ncbi:MAG TPA: erythromycin esterase family protein [Azospirillaceae bacterium]|nr:erythromycin esterase family protein [Azospirillaceae bacterium]
MDTHTPARGVLADRIARAARPLPDPDDAVFADAFDDLGSARIVLLGESSHGTSEFYRARAAITRRLVERHGFTIVAVEADWPDAAQVDAVVRGGARPSTADGPPFQRFPTWMWRNREMADLIGWMRAYNDGVPDPEAKVGFFGLDLYSMRASIQAVLNYLDRIDPETGKAARKRYACLEPWQDRPERYGRAALSEGFGRCEQGVLATLRDLLEKRIEYAGQGGAQYFDAAQNARLVADAERYYRALYLGGEDTWNLRDTHMADSLQALLDWRPGAKAVVWAHNSHIGDARATGMADRGELNLGQLCRERWGDDRSGAGRAVRLVGFGTHAGTVAAADDWGEPVRIRDVVPSLPDSVERACHDAGLSRFVLALGDEAPDGLTELGRPMLQRFIGVVYRPETERWSHYIPCRLVSQYDRYVYFDTSRAVRPLPSAPPSGATPDTFPFGL